MKLGPSATFGTGTPSSSVFVVPTVRASDARGWFSETYSDRSTAATRIGMPFVQDNHSYSKHLGTIRGLHFQRPPHAQAKLVRCTRGSILDYAIDIRAGSPTYGHWVRAKLTQSNGDQLFIPVGFAHGFITLEEDVEVQYKVSDFYSKECDAGIIWNDVDIGIDWPEIHSEFSLSDKDKNLPNLREFVSPFEYDGIPLQSAI